MVRLFKDGCSGVRNKLSSLEEAVLDLVVTPLPIGAAIAEQFGDRRCFGMAPLSLLQINPKPVPLVIDEAGEEAKDDKSVPKPESDSDVTFAALLPADDVIGIPESSGGNFGTEANHGFLDFNHLLLLLSPEVLPFPNPVLYVSSL